MENDYIAQLSKVFEGAQTADKEGKDTPQIYGEYQKTVEMIKKNNSTYLIPADSVKGVIRNFSTTIPFDTIESVILEAGGQWLEKIDGDHFKVLQNVYQIDNDKLPFYLGKIGIVGVEWHDIIIKFTFKSGVKTTYDWKVSFDVYSTLIDIPVDLYYQTQIFCNNRIVVNHPVSVICVKGYAKSINLDLTYASKDKSCKYFITLHKTEFVDGYSLFYFGNKLNDFEHMINFSRVDVAIIKCDESETIPEGFVISTQVLKIRNGMYGVKYSK